MAEAALKRITLTIPAKSYVSRIDAEKREIETAVAGVKLFSVASVSDKQVQLTDELHVVAVQMFSTRRYFRRLRDALPYL